MTNKPTVSFVTLVLSHYRIPFHKRVREILAENGINYRLVYSDPIGSAESKGDTVDLPWAIKVPVKKYSVLGTEMFWQRASAHTRDADLTIISQENKLLLNYLLLLRQWIWGKNLAFFGHGKNFQSRNPNGLRERLKRFFATRVHWWFAYTPGVKRIVEAYGFPESRITINFNSIDTASLRHDIDSVTDVEIEAMKRQLGIESSNIAVYVGGMYLEKRLPFLIEAATEIRKQVADFRLLLVGSGSHAEIAKIAAANTDFIDYLGPRFGRDKAILLKMSKAFVMPGLVGLAVMDAFAAGCPLVTTNVGYHSPEIEYLEDGINGIVVEDAESIRAYADVIIKLLTDDLFQQRLSEAARHSAEHYSIERMAESVSQGILDALNYAACDRYSSCKQKPERSIKPV